jgi:GH24 family phage-related lysozyme (muramidase)
LRTTKFVAGFEGFVSCPYNDPAGHATIGYGHLLHHGPVTKKDKRRWGCISQKRGLRLLRKDLRETEAAVFERIAGATVTPSMITALTSFAFNLGAGALDPRRSQGQPRGTAIARKVVKGKYRKAGKDMLLYDGIIVNGKRYELKGLQIRRRKEFRLMVKDIDQVTSCGKDCTAGDGSGSTSGGITVG